MVETGGQCHLCLIRGRSFPCQSQGNVSTVSFLERGQIFTLQVMFTCRGHQLFLIQGIEIHNNPWLCDCRLLEFSRYFQMWAKLFSNLVSTISNFVKLCNFVKIGLSCSTWGSFSFSSGGSTFFKHELIFFSKVGSTFFKGGFNFFQRWF